jgi:hypothetical protein
MPLEPKRSTFALPTVRPPRLPHTPATPPTSPRRPGAREGPAGQASCRVGRRRGLGTRSLHVQRPDQSARHSPTIQRPGNSQSSPSRVPACAEQQSERPCQATRDGVAAVGALADVMAEIPVQLEAGVDPIAAGSITADRPVDRPPSMWTVSQPRTSSTWSRRGRYTVAPLCRPATAKYPEVANLAPRPYSSTRPRTRPPSARHVHNVGAIQVGLVAAERGALRRLHIRPPGGLLQQALQFPRLGGDQQHSGLLHSNNTNCVEYT